MKNNNLLFIAILFLFLSITKTKAQTVYVTDSGKKYHAKNCSIVKTGKKGMELSEAKKAGYEPCKSCKADDIKIEPDKPKEKKAKK
jgi:methylphosphotriester-DNA--protein-cysteine methyltransferase